MEPMVAFAFAGIGIQACIGVFTAGYFKATMDATVKQLNAIDATVDGHALKLVNHSVRIDTIESEIDRTHD